MRAADPWDFSRGVFRPLAPLIALLLTLLSAPVLALAYPQTGLWWCAPIGVGLHLLALRGQRPRFAALLGFVTGGLFYLIHVQWTSLFLGPVPWIALSVLMAAWWLFGAVLIALAYRRLSRMLNPRGQLLLLPVAVASLWSLRELLSATWPYGGFAWGRLAQSQANSPLLDLVSWLGFTGLGFVIVWFVAVTLETLRNVATTGWPRNRAVIRWQWATSVAGLAAIAVLLVTLPGWQLPKTGVVRVLAVQGDTPGSSYFIPAAPGEIMTAHAKATLAALRDAGKVDLVLWPEGSVDISPFDDVRSAELLDEIAAAADAPLLVGMVTRTGDWDDPATKYFNSQVVWQKTGAGERYDKAHPIPFGEYVPDRAVFAALAPDLIDMIQREYTPGDLPNTLSIDGTVYGVFICYDIVDDALAREAAAANAGVLLAPTNNADFGHTAESAQQLATAKLRAVESGRAIVQASTVGWSAAFAPDGTQIAGLNWYEPGAYVAEVPVVTGQTPATALGRGIDTMVCGAGIAMLLASGGLRGVRHRQ